MSQSNANYNILSNQVGLADSPAVDAFSRLRVSSPVTLFTAQCQYDAEPLLFEAGATGTGVTPAHSANSRMVALSCTAGTGTCFMQSYEYVPYQPGKSQLIYLTGMLDAAVAGAVVDFGIFDAANGIFLRQNGTSGLQVVRRTSTSGSVADNVVSQASWNLDKLNGTGASGVTLDVTKAMILVIDAQFLSMGRVRIGFDIGGMIVFCHEFLHANVITVPYMQTLSLPVQMLITATATGDTKTSYFKCASVSSEGGLETDLSFQFATPEQIVTAGSGARTHILSVRPLTTFNSLTNRSKFILQQVSILVTGANPVLWELAIGSTFSAGPTYGSVDSTYSAFQYSSAVGTVSTLGTLVTSGYVGSSNQVNAQVLISRAVAHRYPLSLDRAGVVRANGTLSLFVTGIGGTSATRATMTFEEIR